MSKKKKVMDVVSCVIVILFFAWLGLSFIDVLCHNDIWASNEYACWNLIAILSNAKIR